MHHYKEEIIARRYEGTRSVNASERNMINLWRCSSLGQCGNSGLNATMAVKVLEPQNGRD